MLTADRPRAPVAIRTDLGAIFISMELSKSTWLMTSLSPGAGERMSRHTIRAGDIAGRFERFALLRANAKKRAGQDFAIIVIHEAGLDGFWIHRALQEEGIESHVADPASMRHRVAGVAPRPTRSTVRRWCARCSPTSEASHVSARWFAIEAIHQACLGGLGIANLSSWDVAIAVAAGAMRRIVLEDAASEPLAIWAVYPTAWLVPTKVRAFIEALECALRKACHPKS